MRCVDNVPYRLMKGQLSIMKAGETPIKRESQWKKFKRITRISKRIFSQKKELFASFSKEQKPSVLFVTCADSRIDPSLLMQTDQGDIFIIRHAGNVIPTYGDAIGGSTATIEYGVSVLQVNDIIVRAYGLRGHEGSVTSGTFRICQPSKPGFNMRKRRCKCKRSLRPFERR